MNNTVYLSRSLDNDRSSNLLFLLGLLVPIMMIAVIVIVGQITPNYNPITDTISQMGAREQPYSIILNSAYIIYGIVIITIAYKLYKSLNHSTLVKALLLLMVIHACGSICLAVFPDKLDNPGGFVTNNIIHNIFSGISYVSLILGILFYSISNLRQQTTNIISIIGFVVVAINLIMPMINLFSFLIEIAGLLQRLLMFCSFSWVILTSTLLHKKMLLNQSMSSSDVNKPASFCANL